jgi:DNA-binding transcriptional LysR family regulator
MRNAAIYAQRMIDARRLQIFREVARRGTISGAAQALWMTQPAVSRQIAALEREAGTQLFNRAARGVSLTEAGRVVLDHADAIAGHLAAAEAKLGDLAELRTGRLRIGTFPTAGATVLLDALTRFHERHPEVELAVLEAPSSACLTRLRAGELDLAVVFDGDPEEGVRPDGIERVHLLTEEMQVALPTGHPLAGAARIELADLSGERWLVGTAPVGVGVIRTACVAAGFEPRVACQVDDPRIIGGLVAAGVGITFTSPLRLEDPPPGVVAVPLVDSPSRHVFAALLPSAHRPAAVEAMLGLLREAGRTRLAV